MPKAVPPEKMNYLAETRDRLLQAETAGGSLSRQRLAVDWLGGCSGRTTINGVELVCDERAESTGEGRGVSPMHTFVAGLAFSHMTQWGRAAAQLGIEVESLREEVESAFDRRGEYLYEEGFPHPGIVALTFRVRIESAAAPEQVMRLAAWADRAPPHATLRRAVRLVGVFYLNGRHLATAVYHPDRTEWRY